MITVKNIGALVGSGLEGIVGQLGQLRGQAGGISRRTITTIGLLGVAALSLSACVGNEYYTVTETHPDGVYAGKFQGSGAWKWSLTKPTGAFTVNPGSNTVIVSRFDIGATAYSTCSQPYATQLRERPDGPILERSANPALAAEMDKQLAAIFDRLGIQKDCGYKRN